ncbi:MAG: hypothetical protein V2A34_02225 [Lentisphaerota bacterium]
MDRQAQNQSFTCTDRLLIGACLLAVLLVYYGLHGLYRPENMDDAWFLSFAHHHIVNGIETDVTFGTKPGYGGYGGVALFGKTFTYLYGHALNLAGWTKSNAHLISTMCLVISALCWVSILQSLKFGRRLSLFFGLAMLLVEPFFGAANQARPDALSFLMVSAALLCFLCRRWGISGFLAAVAVEIHPIGVYALVFIASAAAARLISGEAQKARQVRMPLWFAAGMGVGGLYYLALHGMNLGLLPAVMSQGNTGGSQVNNILFEYFFKTKHMRHIPELVAILACAFIFIFKRYHRENAFVPVFLAASVLFTFVIQRPNFMYAIYVYPAFLLLILWVFERHGRLGLAAGLLLACLLPQFGLVYWQNRHWDMEKYLAQVRSLTPAESVPMVGRPNDWFAFVDRPFFAVDYRGDFRAAAPEIFVLVEDESFRNNGFPKVKSVADQFYTSTECGRFQSRGETVVVKRLVRKKGETGEAGRPPSSLQRERETGFFQSLENFFPIFPMIGKAPLCCPPSRNKQI